MAFVIRTIPSRVNPPDVDIFALLNVLCELMISTHILDLNSGLPAKDVAVQLEKQSGDTWKLIADERTNGDGRIAFNCSAEAGIYRLTFQLEEYLQKNKLAPFFVVAPVTFNISDTKRKYHIPLLLSPFGYSTYRGS